MAFPKAFYKRKKEVGVRRTALPTGILWDPMDLVNNPRPWITIEEKVSTEDNPKKTLIFADHFFKHRSPEEQRAIIKNLRKAKRSGFTILVQWPDSQLQEWDGNELAKNYSLDFEVFSLERLASLAWEQRKRSADDIFVLDYWGINELLGEERQSLNWSTFVDHHEDFQQLVSLATERFFRVKFEHPTVNLASEFFTFFTKYKTSLPAKKFKEFDFSKSKMTLEDLYTLYKAIPWVEKLKAEELLDSAELDLSGFAEGLAPGQLQHLKEFRFHGKLDNQRYRDISNTGSAKLRLALGKNLIQLLKSGPSLQKIAIDMFVECDFEKFSAGELSHIKEFDLQTLCYSNIKDLISLFKVMPNLEKMKLCLLFKIGDYVKELKESNIQMLQLKEIHLSAKLVWTPADLEAFQLIAPNAKILIKMDFFSGFVGIRNLPSLKGITFTNWHYDPREVASLLKAVPALERMTFLHFRPNGFSGLIRSFSSDALPCLKKLTISNPNQNLMMVSDELVAFLKAAPTLEELDLTGYFMGEVYRAFNCFSNGRLRNLRKIRCPHNADYNMFDVADRQRSHTVLKVIANAAPEIEELELIPQVSNCLRVDQYDRGLNLLFLWLDPNQLPKLSTVKISLFPRVELSALGLIGLLNAAPFLEKMVFSPFAPGEVNITLTDIDKLQAHQREKLIDFGFPYEALYPKQEAATAQIKLFLNKMSSLGQLERPQFKILGQNNFDVRLDSEKQLSYLEYFRGVPPSRYRLRLWLPKLATLEGSGEFEPTDFSPRALDKRDYTLDKNYACYPGEKRIIAQDGTAILLPSLDSEECLFDVQLFDAHGKLLDPQKTRLEYSRSTQFYRLVLPEAGQFHLKFKAAVPVRAEPVLPVKIKDLVTRYNKFSIATDPHKRVFCNLREFATYIQEKEVGSCWHRCVAAFEELETKEEYNEYRGKVRIVMNGVHAFLEIQIKSAPGQAERWHQLDLGGYPCKLEKRVEEKESTQTSPLRENQIFSEPFIQEEKHPPSIPKTLEEKKNSPPALAQPFLMTEKTLDYLLLDEKKPCLVLAASDLAAQDFYAQLRRTYPSKDIFLAHSPENLSLSLPGMTEAGEVKSDYTDFNRWLKEHANQTGVVVVDIRLLNETELAQLNDLLEGKIDKQKLPQGVRVILVDHLSRGYYGPDFRRRVPHKASAIEPDMAVLLPDKPDRLQEEKGVVEIDLYHSPYWQQLLIGKWQVGEAKEADVLTFNWRKGHLLSALESRKQHLVFKNPPLQDPLFTRFISELQSLRQLRWADQTAEVPEDVRFYQTTGYDWPLLAKNASLQRLSTTSSEALPVLSDANILSFIDDPRFVFSSKTNCIERSDSYLTLCEKQKKPLDLVCSPGLSQGALAQLMTAAQERGIQVRIFAPTISAVPEDSPLHALFPDLGLEEKTETAWKSPSVRFQISDDLYFAARHALAENKEATCFDLSCLETTELDRFPLMNEKLQTEFLKTGKLRIEAPFSDLIEKLKKGETVILYGKIPLRLYPILTTLSLGFIEGVRIKGTLLVIAPAEDKSVIRAISGQRVDSEEASDTDKLGLLETLYPKEAKEFKAPEKTSFATLERSLLKEQLDQRLQVSETEEKSVLSDEKRAQAFDQTRLHNVEQALTLNPWVMIEGPTGLGKTYFLEKVLPTSTQETPVSDFKKWLTTKPTDGKNLTLIVDEASFLSQLSAEGENFLERFKGLQGKAPGFLWKGVYYPLTKQHKVIFTFNPASYGAGRSTSGFLSEHLLPVTFQHLPDYYLRARLIMPLFKAKRLPDLGNVLSSSMIQVYRWIMDKSPQESLITPREIKAMANLLASQVKKGLAKTPKDLKILAAEAAYLIGRQTLSDSPQLLQQFEAASFKPQKSVLNKIQVPAIYQDQREAYLTVQYLLDMRKDLLEAKNASTDLGLGGLVLEGGAGIGKTYFLNQLAQELEEKGQKVYRISPTTPYLEKERLLKQAFAEGALLVADEINASLWPNKLLNNFLMGLDENNQPAEKPGFMLLATQNPPSFLGRSQEDPAFRRRVLKLKLDWPVYSEVQIRLSEAKPKLLQLEDLAPICFALFDLKEKQVVFLKKLAVLLKQNSLTRAQILDLFQQLRDKNGRFGFIHQQEHPRWDCFRLLFKSNRNKAFQDEKYFWHTQAYQKAVKLLKETYLQQPPLQSPERQIEENIFIDYVRGNAPVHWSRTETRKKIV